MQPISVNELANQKIFPYNIYDDKGEKLFSAGELLTPGKLMQLRSHETVFRNEEEPPIEESSGETEDLEYNNPEEAEKTSDSDNLMPNIPNLDQGASKSDNFSAYDFSADDTSSDSDEVMPIEVEEQLIAKQINLHSIISHENQVKMKKSYKKALNYFLSKKNQKKVDYFMKTRDLIIETITPVIDNMIYKSQLKLIGPYEEVHGVNVAIMATVLTKKMKMNDSVINDIVLAALLHDIGKTRIDESILKKATLSTQDINLLNLHTQIGYKILHKDFNLSEHICRVALEHHENNDGSGFPYGISGDLIGMPSKIVNLCNFYDNLTSEKLNYPVKNTKEALKIILEIGSKNFLSGIVYTFINMSNYNDSKAFKSLAEE